MNVKPGDAEFLFRTKLYDVVHSQREREGDREKER